MSWGGGEAPVGGTKVPIVAGFTAHLLVHLIGAVLAQHLHSTEDRLIRLTALP